MFKVWILLLIPMTLRTVTTISGFFVKEPKMDKEKNLGGEEMFGSLNLRGRLLISQYCLNF